MRLNYYFRGRWTKTRWGRRALWWIREVEFYWLTRRGQTVTPYLFFRMVRRRQCRESVTWETYVRRDPCSYCGRYNGRMTIEHVTPLGRGGRDVTANKAAACWQCNQERGSRPLFHFLFLREQRRLRCAKPTHTARKIEAQFKTRLKWTTLGEIARWHDPTRRHPHA